MAWFGSKNEFVADGQITGRVEQLIRSAAQHVVIVSPYIGPGLNLQNLLVEKAKSLKVTIVFRADKADEYRREGWFEAFVNAGIDLRVLERLHAKIFSNGERVIVGSANFLADSWTNSRECMFDLEVSSNEGKLLEPYLKSLVEASQPVSKQIASKAPKAARSQKRDEQGHCIRCGDHIPLNSDRPYCKDDFDAWNQYKNPDFKDKYCHACGESFPATMNKPLCRECFASL